MTDLTKIKKPFGQLDKETQDALRAHKGEFQVFLDGEWMRAFGPSLIPEATYRAAPGKLPNWPAGLHGGWRWIAMNEDGVINAFNTKPERQVRWWDAAVSCRIDRVIDISFDGNPWQQAIIQRPEGV